MGLIDCVKRSRGALVQKLVWGVIALSRVKDLEAHVLDTDLTVFDTEKLSSESLEVMLYFHEQVGCLLEGDVQLTTLSYTIFVLQNDEELWGNFHISLEFK